jgi:hypothetical protein
LFLWWIAKVAPTNPVLDATCIATATRSLYAVRSRMSRKGTHKVVVNCERALGAPLCSALAWDRTLCEARLPMLPVSAELPRPDELYM